MMDIVQRLRSESSDNSYLDSLYRDAADEIDHLRGTIDCLTNLQTAEQSEWRNLIKAYGPPEKLKET